MALPTSATRHYRRIQRLKILTVSGMRRAWRDLAPGPTMERQYEQRVGRQIAALAVAAQVAATRESDTYVADVLTELAIGPPTTPGVVIPQSLAGVMGDGRPVESLFATSVGRARAVASTVDAPEVQSLQQGMEAAMRFIESAAETMIADAMRAAEAVALAPRLYVDGYVRMLNPPSCSRCVVTAGAFYRWNDGFERHDGCDCLHIPASEAIAGDLTVDPQAYFDSLTEAEQDKAFTKAGAQAIRDGADIGQVVNARRGMRTAQVFGREALITTEGTTARGIAGKALGDLQKVSGSRYRVSQVPRLMPESIYQYADSREQAVALLRRFGYIP